MLNLYVDVQAKLKHEFRRYGANIVVAAKDGQELPKDALSTVQSVLGNTGIAAPFAYAVARTSDCLLGSDCRNRLRASAKIGWLVVRHRLAQLAR